MSGFIIFCQTAILILLTVSNQIHHPIINIFSGGKVIDNSTNKQYNFLILNKEENRA
jgi:hypothetical protein